MSWPASSGWRVLVVLLTRSYSAGIVTNKMLLANGINACFKSLITFHGVRQQNPRWAGRGLSAQRYI